MLADDDNDEFSGEVSDSEELEPSIVKGERKPICNMCNENDLKFIDAINRGLVKSRR